MAVDKSLEINLTTSDYDKTEMDFLLSHFQLNSQTSLGCG